MKKLVFERLNLIAQTIYDKKGLNILALDVEGLSSITDCILIAEANVDRHTIAVAHAVMGVLKEKGESPARVEGLQTGDWVVLDYVDIMIHLFSPGLREKYGLEKLWGESKIVDLQITAERTL